MDALLLPQALAPEHMQNHCVCHKVPAGTHTLEPSTYDALYALCQACLTCAWVGSCLLLSRKSGSSWRRKKPNLTIPWKILHGIHQRSHKIVDHIHPLLIFQPSYLYQGLMVFKLFCHCHCHSVSPSLTRGEHTTPSSPTPTRVHVLQGIAVKPLYTARGLCHQTPS